MWYSSYCPRVDDIYAVSSHRSGTTGTDPTITVSSTSSFVKVRPGPTTEVLGCNLAGLPHPLLRTIRQVHVPM